VYWGGRRASNNSSARPGAWRHGEQAQPTRAAARRRPGNDSTVFTNARGQVVGCLQDGWLTKHVDSRIHQLRKPPAWCIDAAHLDRLEALRAQGVRLLDEQGTEWRTTVRAFRDYGIPLDRGHGPQVALSLARWQRRDPRQPRLPGLEA
jgi:hypothetical protein